MNVILTKTAKGWLATPEGDEQKRFEFQQSGTGATKEEALDRLAFFVDGGGNVRGSFIVKEP